MKIHAFRISNFGSIEDVSLEDLTELTILVGKNGSGKTFLLDGLRLFFEEFAVIGGESSTKDNDYLWHQRDTSRPITVNVILELEDEEYRKCAEELGIPDDRIDSGMKKGRNRIEATRELEFGVGWASLRIGIHSPQVSRVRSMVLALLRDAEFGLNFTLTMGMPKPTKLFLIGWPKPGRKLKQIMGES